MRVRLTKIVGAVLRDAFSLHRTPKEYRPRGEKVMQQTNIIEVPEVQEILAGLRQAREQHSVILTEKMGADSELNRVVSELGAARAQLGQQEKALAISGGLPEGAFPEEAEIARLERQHRVLLARGSATQKRVAASRKAIDDLKTELDSAWLKVGVERCQELMVRFREAAWALRKVQCDHMAWLQCFASRPGVPEIGKAFVTDPFGKWGIVVEPDGSLTLDRHLVNSTHVREESCWKPTSGVLAEAIRALHTEVEAAKRETGDTNG